MGTILLSGGGDKKPAEKLKILSMERLTKEKSLLYIPIALEATVPYKEREKWAKDLFAPFGIIQIVMWTELQNKKLEDLRAFSGIYIGGGNTFSLLMELRESGFGKVLKEYWIEGGTVIGSSAGAIILGEDIGTCAHLDTNTVGLKELGGLKLAGGFSVWCHYSPDDDALIEKSILENETPILALSEKTGALLDAGKLTMTGTFPAVIFQRRGKEIERLVIRPDETITF